jgi:hypothetical protein
MTTAAAKPKSKADTKDEPDNELPDDVDPDHRFAGLADPPLSDPAHPDHLDWQHEHAGGPAPDELEAIHAEQEKAAKAEAKAAADRADAEAEQDKADAKADKK